jgi:hypothetical protein
VGAGGRYVRQGRRSSGQQLANHDGLDPSARNGTGLFRG